MNGANPPRGNKSLLQEESANADRFDADGEAMIQENVESSDEEGELTVVSHHRQKLMAAQILDHGIDSVEDDAMAIQKELEETESTVANDHGLIQEMDDAISSLRVWQAKRSSHAEVEESDGNEDASTRMKVWLEDITAKDKLSAEQNIRVKMQTEMNRKAIDSLQSILSSPRSPRGNTSGCSNDSPDVDEPERPETDDIFATRIMSRKLPSAEELEAELKV